MITRHQAEDQARHCLEYHAAIYAGIVGVVALFNRPALPWVAASLGAGLTLHAASLYAIPGTRETLLRTTASLMEDHQHSLEERVPERQQTQSRRPEFVGAAS